MPGDRVERGQVLARVQPQLAGADWLAVAGNRQQGLSLRQANEAMKFELDTLRVELTVKLAEVTAREIQSQAALQKAERTLARVRDLRAQEAKSEREVEEAEFALRAAQAEREANRTLLVEVLPVRRDWVEAKIASLQALREVDDARAEVERLGGK